MAVEEWKKTTLGAIAKLEKGISYSAENYCEETEGLPFITIKCFGKGGGYSDRGIKYYNGSFKPEQKVCAGDIIIANTDLTRDGDIIGSPIIVPEKFGKDGALISMDLSKMLFKEKEVHSRFLYYTLTISSTRSFMKAHSAGSTVLHLQTKSVPKMSLNLPPLQEQKKIAAILGSVDDAISKTEAVIDQTRRVKQGLLQDLLTRGIGHTKFKQTEIGEIPETWEVIELAEIAEKTRNSFVIGPFGSDLVKSDYQAEGVPVVFVRDIKPTSFQWKSDVFVTTEKAAELKAHDVKPGDIVVTKMGLPPGIAAVYPDKMPSGIVTADIIRIRLAKERALATFITETLSWVVVSEQVRLITGGQTRPKLTLRDYKKIKVPLPPLDEQKRISAILAKISEIESRDREAVKRYQTLKTGLMSDLLTGRIRVNAAHIKEKAA